MEVYFLSAGHRWNCKIFPKEDELNKKNEQMAVFNKVAANRELKMIELKKEQVRG